MRQNKRLLPKKHLSSRNRQDNKRKNILSPIRKQRERKEHHHVNPKRPSSRNKREQKEETPVDDNKYRPPSGIDHYLVETIETSVIQRVMSSKYKSSTASSFYTSYRISELNGAMLHHFMMLKRH